MYSSYAQVRGWVGVAAPLFFMPSIIQLYHCDPPQFFQVLIYLRQGVQVFLEPGSQRRMQVFATHPEICALSVIYL